MADNKVNFLRGTSAEYESSTKDNDTFYYTTDTKKLYLGENEVGNGIDPKVIQAHIDNQTIHAKVWKGTQEEYNAIEPKEDDTVYIIKDSDNTLADKLIDDTSTTATDKTWSAKKINENDEVARAAINAHSGNEEIHVTAAEKASWNGKAEISDIPATLPANGGNAQALIDYNSTDVRLMLGWRGSPLDSTDYLAGYDRSELESNGIVKIKEFPVSKLPLREGNMYLDIFSTSLSSNHACWNKNCYVTGQSANADSEDYIENAPEITGHQLWYEVFTCGHRMRAYQIAFGCYNWQNNVFIRFKHDDTWSEWANVSDGGNADSVGAYTEAKLAALEARIAALEGGTT